MLCFLQVKLVGRESSASPAPVQQPPQPGPSSQDETNDEEMENHSIKGRTKSITDHIAQVSLLTPMGIPG